MRGMDVTDKVGCDWLRAVFYWFLCTDMRVIQYNTMDNKWINHALILPSTIQPDGLSLSCPFF